MRELIARHPALRGLWPWLLVMFVGSQMIVGVQVFMVHRTQAWTDVPLLIGGWILLAEYLAWSRVRHRCSRFDLALPLEARTLWTASLIGSSLAALLMLVVLLGLMALIFGLAGFLEPVHVPGVGDFMRLGAILAAAAVVGVAWRQTRKPELASLPTGIRASLEFYVVNLGLLAPLLWLRHRPGLLVPLLLAAAAALIVIARRRVVGGYVLAPATMSAPGKSVKKTESGAPRAARGLQALWLHYQMIVRTAPKGPALIVVFMPFMLLFGALLSGLLLHLIPDSDLRFAYMPMTAYMCVTFAAPLTANLRAVDAWPISRRRVLALISLPALAVFSIGYLGGVIWIDRTPPVPPEIIFCDEDEGYGLRVPTYMWRMSWDGEAPPAVSPTGESHPVETIPLIKGATPLLYKPYSTPMGSSRDFVAWQIRRAAGAMRGTRLSAEEIADRFLWTDTEGRVRLKTERLELFDGDWAILARGIGPFFPITLALTALLMYFGIAVYARAVRAGISRTRRQVQLWSVLGALLLLHLTPYGLTLVGLSRPWILERIMTDTMMTIARAVPGGHIGLWIAALLVAVIAFEAALRVFERSESPVQPEACVWETLAKGE